MSGDDAQPASDHEAEKDGGGATTDGSTATGAPDSWVQRARTSRRRNFWTLERFHMIQLIRTSVHAFCKSRSIR
jgi:hypothetical protein